MVGTIVCTNEKVEHVDSGECNEHITGMNRYYIRKQIYNCIVITLVVHLSMQ